MSVLRGNGLGRFWAGFIIGVFVALLFVILVSLVLILAQLTTMKTPDRINLVIAVGTLAAAFFASVAAKQTAKGVQAQLLWGLLNDYSQEDMLDALTYLVWWYDQEPQKSHLAATLKNLQGTSDWPDKKLVQHRRRFAHYCQNVYALWYRAKLLDDRAAQVAMDKERARTYLFYVEPLEWARRRDYERDSFEFYEREYQLSRRVIKGLPEDWYRRPYPSAE